MATTIRVMVMFMIDYAYPARLVPVGSFGYVDVNVGINRLEV